MQIAGFSLPSLATLAQYHPQFAWAVWNGVAMRPNLRPLSVELNNAQQGNPQNTSFSTVIGQYSVFAGLGITLDPTGNLNGNPLKYLSDAAEPYTPGVTATILVQSNTGTNYSPVPDDTPLQKLPELFASSIGSWYMKNPENLRASFTLQSPLQGAGAATVWLVFAFYVLESGGERFFGLPVDEARRRLAAVGLLPPQAAPP